jgi:hypothetical protein
MTKTRFITFCPRTEYDRVHGNYNITATQAINNWLAENPEVEIIDWRTTAVGPDNILYITVQYKEN